MRIEFLDVGRGTIALQYDSTDTAPPLDGAYKQAPRIIRRDDSGQWRTGTFRLDDARFGGRQNGDADFRFFISGDELKVRRVGLEKVR